MRRGFLLAALLPLGGCYVPPDAGYPQPYGYAPPAYQQPAYEQPGYPPQGYPQPGYAQPGYAQPAPYDAYGNVYPGYAENDGSPTLIVEGAPMPLIFFGDSWGYYDRERHWHRAPEQVYRHLEERRAVGGFHGGPGGFRPPAGGPPSGGAYQQQRPENHAVPAAAPPNRAPPQQFHQPEPARPAAPAAYAAPHPAPGPAPQQPHHEEHRRDCPPGQRC